MNLQSCPALSMPISSPHGKKKGWQDVGADSVVAQGVGAGGHQGGWLDEQGDRLSVLDLLKLAKLSRTKCHD